MLGQIWVRFDRIRGPSLQFRLYSTKPRAWSPRLESCSTDFELEMGRAWGRVLPTPGRRRPNIYLWTGLRARFGFDQV